MKNTTIARTTWKCGLLIELLAIAAIAGAVGCQDEVRTAGTQFSEGPRSPGHDQLIAEASRSTALTDEIALLQRAGWTGGDLAQARSLRNGDGQIAITLAFARDADRAALDLLYMSDGEGSFRGFVRPRDAVSAAVLSRSLESADDGDAGALASSSGDPSAPVEADPATARQRAATASDLAAVHPSVQVAALSPPTTCGYLSGNQGLVIGQTLTACYNGYRLVMQSDGNLVAYTSGGKVVWATNRTGHHVVMQTDGNLVEYSSSGSAVWVSNTAGHSGAYFRLQDDGNLVVYSSSGGMLWSSGTYCTGCTGGACKLWGCSYVSSTGTSTACIGIPDEINLIGRYYYFTTRKGHTDPASCSALYADYLGYGQACPSPNTVSSIFTCGDP